MSKHVLGGRHFGAHEVQDPAYSKGWDNTELGSRSALHAAFLDEDRGQVLPSLLTAASSTGAVGRDGRAAGGMAPRDWAGGAAHTEVFDSG